MSIEKNIESIAASLASIAESMRLQPVAPSEQVVAAPVQPVLDSQPSTQTFTTPETVNQVPSFAPPAFDPVAPTQGPLPFADTAGFTQYLIASFQKLEAKAPGTGGNIQRVIESIGCKNVNEVQPGSWAAVYTEVEKLVA